MKKLAFLLLTFAVTCGSAAGQNHSFRANVPFDFVVGLQRFPPGTYRFQRPLGKPSAAMAEAEPEVAVPALR